MRRSKAGLAWAIQKVGLGEAPGQRKLGRERREHLGVLLDTQEMRVYVTDRKLRHVQRMVKKLVVLAHRNRRLVPLGLLRRFCGVCFYLTLAFPMTRFFTRSI